LSDLKDILGRTLEVGDSVAYGKSDRNHPIKVGKILAFDYEKEDIIVKAVGGYKDSKIPMFHSKRFIKLPEGYLEGL